MSLTTTPSAFRLSSLQEFALGPQPKRLFSYLAKVPRHSISAREALHDLDMTSATLSRRICDLKECGVNIRAERCVHPTTGKRYTRYHLEGVDPNYGLRNKRTV